MKRLIALLCLVMLAVFVGVAGAQVAGFPKLTVQQLRWADYSDAVTSGISAYRDTTTFTAGALDTTDVFDATGIAYALPGTDATTSAHFVLRYLMAGSNTNADSFYVTVNGAYSPLGPWFAFTRVGYLGNVADQTTDGLATAILIGDVDDLTATTPSSAVWQAFPYYRFVVGGEGVVDSETFAGVRFYVSYYTWRQ